MESDKKYIVKKQKVGTYLLIVSLALFALGELLAIFSANSSTTYGLTNLTTIELLTEITLVIFIVCFVLTYFIKGKVYMIIFDAVKFGVVAVMCYCAYSMLSERATLMGYVWFSDLESSSQTAINALNFGVWSAVCYIVGIIVFGVACWYEFVDAVPVKKSKSELRQEIKEIEDIYDEAPEETLE